MTISFYQVFQSKWKQGFILDRILDSQKIGTSQIIQASYQSIIKVSIITREALFFPVVHRCHDAEFLKDLRRHLGDNLRNCLQYVEQLVILCCSSLEWSANSSTTTTNLTFHIRPSAQQTAQVNIT